MSKIEKFATEHDLIKRLEELRDLDVSSDNLKVISQHPVTNEYDEFNHITTINAEGSAWDKIVSFFSSGDPTDRVFNNINLSHGDKDEYRQALERNEILLYIDSESKLGGETQKKSDYDYGSTNTRLDHQDKYVSEENMTDFTEDTNHSSYNSLPNEEKIDQAGLREENKKLNRK